jgi:GntR family transcriptional regulator
MAPKQKAVKQKAVVQELVNTSLASRARGAILEAILDGRFDTRLPNEDELARMLNVSRTTIRSALQGLEQEGIITRRRALGTRINRHVGPATLGLQRMVGFDWLLRENHRDVRVDISWEIGDPPEPFADIFGAEGECVALSKAFIADGDLALHIRDVVPTANVRDTNFDADLPASLFEFSRRWCVEPIDHAVVEIAPMVKDGGGELPLDEGTPFIRLHETHYTRGADAIAYSLIDVDDRYIRLEVFRREQG